MKKLHELFGIETVKEAMHLSRNGALNTSASIKEYAPVFGLRNLEALDPKMALLLYRNLEILRRHYNLED